MNKKVESKQKSIELKMSSEVVGEIAKEIVKFNWQVDVDCFKDKKARDKILSPTFYTYGLNRKKNEWRLELCPKGYKVSEGWLSLYLANLSNYNIDIEFSLSLLNQNNLKVDNHYDDDCYSFYPNKASGYEKFVKESFIMDPKNNVLKDNKMTILCKIKMGEASPETDTETNSAKNSSKLKDIDRFEIILKRQEYSDVTIISEGRSFYLHKCMLTSFSDTFAVMFKHDIINKQQKSTLELDDIKCEVLQELFRFIYTGEVADIDNILCKLLAAAERFGVEALKALCEETMVDKLTKDNAIDYLNLAITNNAQHLKKDIIGWISVRLSSFIYSPDFHEFGKQYPEILLQIVQKNYTSENIISNV